MLRKRIIPCLDVKDGKVVKGVHFENLVEMGDPAAHARFYNEAGADEIVFLDISASHEERQTTLSVIESVAACVFIPLTVGGGIRTVADVRDTLNAGADRVGINTAAVKNPALITEAAEHFGSQCVVVAVDVRKRNGGEGWEVYTYGGRQPTGIDGLEWMREAERRGAGEILLTSMDRDGTQAGYDLELLKEATASLSIPVIASGGAGTIEHFAEALISGGADAILAASLFHTRSMSIGEVKQYLAQKGVAVR